MLLISNRFDILLRDSIHVVEFRNIELVRVSSVSYNIIFILFVPKALSRVLSLLTLAELTPPQTAGTNEDGEPAPRLLQAAGKCGGADKRGSLAC